jgi:hypothetical protein
MLGPHLPWLGRGLDPLAQIRHHTIDVQVGVVGDGVVPTLVLPELILSSDGFKAFGNARH